MSAFGSKALGVEVHVLDEIGDLRGCRAMVGFLERFREEKRFASEEALVAQIGRDITKAHEVKENYDNNPKIHVLDGSSLVAQT